MAPLLQPQTGARTSKLETRTKGQPLSQVLADSPSSLQSRGCFRSTLRPVLDSSSRTSVHGAMYSTTSRCPPGVVGCSSLTLLDFSGGCRGNYPSTSVSKPNQVVCPHQV